jgi:hypothetical protein
VTQPGGVFASSRIPLWIIALGVAYLTIASFWCCPPTNAIRAMGPDDCNCDSVGVIPDTMRVAVNDTILVYRADSVRVKGPHAGYYALNATGLKLLPPP